MSADTFALLHEPDQRLVRTVDGLSDDELAAPSALPGWTRAHVVAHLALNAEGMIRILHGVVEDDPAPMYPSPEQRDADIRELAAAGPAELRERLMGSTKELQRAARHLTDDQWAGVCERTPGGPVLRLRDLGRMRLQEVEVHHADLDAGYTVHDWDEEFLDRVFNTVVEDRRGLPVMLRTPDGAVPLGDGGPEVSGSRADLTWWLLGRGDGRGLTAEPHLPTLGPWR